MRKRISMYSLQSSSTGVTDSVELPAGSKVYRTQSRVKRGENLRERQKPQELYNKYFNAIKKLKLMKKVLMNKISKI